MSSNKLPIPAEVMEGLEAVRVCGETNMFDVSMVISLALDLEYSKTATWVRENRKLYLQGVLIGFKADDTHESGGDEQCAD
jgi:hypothetical protein